MVTGPEGRATTQATENWESTAQMHPMMIQQLADLQLNEARDRAAQLRLARQARRARLAGTIRPERRLHRWRSARLSIPALRDLSAV